MVTEESIKQFSVQCSRIFEETGKDMIGQSEVVENTIVALIAGGNVLLEGVPGVGKTRLVRTLSRVFNLPFSRIQFTPDLMPADVTGTNIITKDEKGADVFTYTAVKNDGTTVELTGANASVAAGIYAYKGTEISTKQSSAKGEVTLISGTTYQIGSNYVTINAKSTVVAVDGELEKGAKVEYIVNSDNVVTLLFVTEAAK